MQTAARGNARRRRHNAMHRRAGPIGAGPTSHTLTDLLLPSSRPRPHRALPLALSLSRRAVAQASCAASLRRALTHAPRRVARAALPLLLLLCGGLLMTPAWPQSGAASRGDAAEAEGDAPAAVSAEDDDEAAPPRPLFDPGVTTLEAGTNRAYRLEVRAPAKLRALLVQHLDLARFREQPDIAPIEVARLVAAAPAQARSLLEPEGYFTAEVEVRRVDSADGRSPPTVTVHVVPGPKVRVGRLPVSYTHLTLPTKA